MLNGKKILVTGGTGSFGQLFIQKTLEKWSPSKIVVFSRDEMKQWEMAKRFNDPRIRYFIGDVRDKERLHRACQGIDYIVHAAAQKIVPSAEYNPIECIRTNIDGAINVVNTAIDAKVKRVVALSTDKACNPINLYGATKLCSDKLFVAGNSYVGAGDTRFSVVRYGNVMGSRGSVIPFFMSIAKTGALPITDDRMTRFMISLDEAVSMVWTALETALGGEIFVKKIPSMKVTDVAQAIAPDAKLVFTGIRPGEKLHEQMISAEDARNTVEFKDYFVILPQIDFLDDRFKSLANEKKCPEGFSYSSDSNTEWMSKEQLQNWIKTNYLPYAQAKEENDLGHSQSQMTSKNESSCDTTDPSAESLISESAMSAIKTDAEKNSISRETISLATKMLKIKDDERMMPDPTKIITVSDPFPSLILAKAIVETRIGKPQEALKTVSSLLVSDPSHLGGKQLLSEVNDLLQYGGDDR